MELDYKNIFSKAGIVFITIILILLGVGMYLAGHFGENSGRRLMTVRLYYPNKILADNLGDPCNKDTLIPVERNIAPSNTPLSDAISLLIQGKLTDYEKQSGFSTEFPNKNFYLAGVNLQNGVLTLTFPDVAGFTGGGSCRVGLLANQIIKTVQQFPGVKSVKFSPDTLFQP